MPDGENGIEYNYSEEKIPTVQDGIVIEDEEGNQFVWVPVGEIKNKKDDKNGEKTEITLGRYTFGGDGTPSEAHDGSYAIVDGIYSYIEENAEEHEKSKYENSIAKDIEGFKASAEINHGYYIARYEAGNNNEKVVSKQGVVWNFVNQIKASEVSQALYGENNNYVSDLINSYAWDTAIVFIQKYSGEEKYSLQGSRNSQGGSPASTGEREETTDMVCNIYDMASNVHELTTETQTLPARYCTARGGACNQIGSEYTSYRYGWANNNAYWNMGFRVVLYTL